MRNVIFVEIDARESHPVAWTRGLIFAEKVACQKVIKREEKQFYATKMCSNATRAQTRCYF